MTEVFRKLNYKDQDPILVLEAPGSFSPKLKALGGTAVHREPKKGEVYSFVLAFAKMKKDLLAAAGTVKSCVGAETVLWFAYPKQTSKAFTSDLNRDLCAAALAEFGLQPVRQVAIDDDWSALRYKPAH